MKRKDNTENLKDVIDRLLKQYNLDTKFNEHEIIAHWNKMLGQMIANKTRQISFRDGVLYVSLESSVIRKELHFAKEKLIANLNESLGKEIIKEIQLR